MPNLDRDSNDNLNNPQSVQDQLTTLVSRCQERTSSEDIDFIEQLGGEQAIAALLGVNFNKGVLISEVEHRRKLYGSNKQEEIPPKSFFELMKDALEDFTLRVLLVAAFVSVVANMIVEKDHREIAWIEGFTIFLAVMICCTVTAVNDYQKDKQFRKLNEVACSKKQVNVWRDGKLVAIHESELVAGDVVKIREGMELNADMMLIQAYEITTDESALTGEPDPMRKKVYKECVESRSEHYSPILMSGTKVLTGEGKAVVLVVGPASCVGKIRSLVQQEPEQTPLQEKLDVVAKDIGKFGLVSAIITFVILLVRFFFDRITTHTLTDMSAYVQILDYIIISITVIVVAIPEGLPLAVTLCLAYSVRQMLHDKNLVRRLEATETMGGADNICSDKTGTLTQNKMTLTSFWNGKIIEIDSYKKGKLAELFPEECHDLIREAFGCNSSATLGVNHGCRTEMALLEFLKRNGEDYEKIRSDYINDSTVRYPFSSQRKRMSTIVSITDSNLFRQRIHTKGAPEIILESCSSFYDFSQGKHVPMTKDLRTIIQTQIENMAGQALRTMCIAYKDMDHNEDLSTKNSKGVFKVEESNFILLGVLGIKDILRMEAKIAINKCKAAGIRVRMVTGDSELTAKAIAKECGIYDPLDIDSLVMTGPEFMEKIGGLVCKNCRTKECDCPRDKARAEKEGKEMRVDTIANQEEFNDIFQRLDVLARSRPEDKYALVTGLLERGAVVAVTGDGTNDAPALKKANVGFAMNSGTDVAKEAADIILVDDNFASIVESVKWGRNIYDNVRRFLQFQLTVNIVAVGITLLGAAILKEAVLTAVQLLWVNLIMDTLASLALATEPPSDELLKRKPQKRSEYIISKTMMKHIIGQAIYQFIIIFTMIFTADKWVPESLPLEEIEEHRGEYKYHSDGRHIRSGRAYLISNGEQDYKAFESMLGPSRHFTMVFNTFVLLQVFNFFNCRKIRDELNVFKGMTCNPFFFTIVSSIAILQVLLGSYGGLPLSVSYHGLDKTQWMICIMLASGCLVWSLVLKVVTFGKGCYKTGLRLINPLYMSLELVDYEIGKKGDKKSPSDFDGKIE